MKLLQCPELYHARYGHVSHRHQRNSQCCSGTVELCIAYTFWQAESFACESHWKCDGAGEDWTGAKTGVNMALIVNSRSEITSPSILCWKNRAKLNAFNWMPSQLSQLNGAGNSMAWVYLNWKCLLYSM